MWANGDGDERGLAAGNESSSELQPMTVDGFMVSYNGFERENWWMIWVWGCCDPGAHRVETLAALALGCAKEPR